MQEANVAVPLLAPSQSVPRSGGPVGRLRRLLNGIVHKQQQDGRLKAEKRGGFPALARDVGDVTTGALVGSSGIPGTTLMGTLGDQLVQIGNSVPYVYAPSGPRYEQFPGLVATETAFRRIVFAGTQSIGTPDAAIVGNVMCFVWVAAGNPYIMFVDLTTGTPRRTAVQLTTGGRVKIVSDGVRFWVFVDLGTNTVHVSAWGTDGVQQDSTTASFLRLAGDPWDVTARPGTGNGVAIAHTSDNGGIFLARITIITFTSSIQVAAAYTDPFLPCKFGVAWLRNDFDSTRLYLGVTTQVSFVQPPDPARSIGIYVGRQNLDGTHDVVYPIETGMTAGDNRSVCNLTGYVASASRDLYVSYARLEQTGGTTRGRAMNSFTTTKYASAPGTVALVGVARSVSLAGRAFKLGSRYVIPAYYASTSQEGAFQTDAVPLPVAQPTYFLLDVVTQKLVGELEFGTASMDWTFQGWDPTTGFGASFFQLPSPFQDATGVAHLPFGFAADDETIQTFPGSSPPLNTEVPIVGILDLQLGGRGVPVEFADELLLPGARAVAFTRDSFAPAGFELAPEPPTVTATIDGSGVMVAGETHRYAFVWSAFDSQGNRVRSIASIATAPSPPLTGGQNALALRIPMLRMTGYATVLLEIYRDAWDATTHVASPELHKITVDAAVFGDPRGPQYNDPTVDTLTFVDRVPNSAAAVGAVIYTNDGTLDYMPPPPFSTGCVLGDRVFVGGYDNRVYYSFSKIPGQAVAFNQDEMFITLPTRQRVKALVPLDNRLFIFCERSIFYVDGDNFLSADGTSGSNPTPIELQFKDGCTGRAVATTEGIVYHSTAGGFWLLTRGLTKEFVGQPVEDDTAGATCLDIAVDADQKIGFLLGGTLVTYDPVHKVWSPWSLPVAGVALCNWQGRMTWADNEAAPRSYKHDPTVYSDNGVPIQTRIELADIALADITGFQVIWEGAFLGEWKGAHTFNIDATYDGSSTVDETFTEAFPTLVEPFRADFQPKTIECSSIGLSIYDTFPDGVPSQGFTLEGMGLYVGVERGKKYNETRIAPTG